MPAVRRTGSCIYASIKRLTRTLCDVPGPAFGRIQHKELTTVKAKNTICLWYDKDAHDAARFYAATFPNSEVIAVQKAPADYPSGKAGDVLTVEFTVLGIPCLGLNGGPAFKHSEAFSFQIATDNQEETDRYWNAIVGNGGQESECGWCKDRWGLSWQITPRTLTDALAAGGDEAKRAFDAMMTMKKIDVATIDAARGLAGASSTRGGAQR
jgi:predicted 3-demethylubiquinone-9 3-methyltransferase (glyoxalase superfamily)